MAFARRPFQPSWAYSEPAAPKPTTTVTPEKPTLVGSQADAALGKLLAATASGIRREHCIVFQTVSAARTLTVAAIVGEDSPKITEGGGGWDTIDRPGRTGLTWWRGRSPITYEIPIILDALAGDSGTVVEDFIADLELMWGRGKPPEGVDWPLQPPAIGIWSPAPGLIPRSLRTFDNGPMWVVNEIDYGDAIRRSNGNRVRQEMTVTLLQLVQSTVQGKSAVRNRNRVSYRPYIVTAFDMRGGNPLKRIAKKVLGDSDRYKEIQDRKGHRIRDWRHIKKGTHLRVPTK